MNSRQAIPAAIRSDIEQRLAKIEAGDDVRLLLVVESGSRAWGFPSPDSDYDIRFVYVRSRDWYLKLGERRDVIEKPITDDIDLNGWDVQKALSLLMKSNAVISEWIDSPIRYRADHPSVAALRRLADDVLDGRALAHHYASLGRNAAARWLGEGGPVPVKRYFYALRPALAIKCLRANPTKRPPMNLQQLIDASGISAAIAGDIAALVAAKALSNELSNAARLPRLDELIAAELDRAGEVSTRPAASAEWLARADDIFLELVNT